nr:uncharacterized protein LOC105466108 isoform X1 [Macaca nemestrina]XP_011713346.1 uncharacterized protein LOC105466108 isoform X1 [Macaca nemestrina]XP_011713347.1 uncharacterized protein LOC105466108 isoform X1 [Macaca nemestrina]
MELQEHQDEKAELQKICEEQEQPLQETGLHLSQSKLKMEDIKEVNQALKGHAWLKDDEAMHCRQCEKFSVSQRNVCGGSTHPPSALSHRPLRFPFLWFQKPASDQAHCPVTVLTGWQIGSPTSPACLCRWLSILATSFWEALASHRPLVSSTSFQ